jgi:D-glycero-D-manno-heptose 1,7-bisphosphate phosphatase
MDNRQLPRAIIFDRDGTLTASLDPVTEPDQIRLLAGAAEAVRACNEANILVGLASNQGIVSRGILPPANLLIVHQRLAELLDARGAHIDSFRYCPHHPRAAAVADRNCDCRKPGPRMLVELAEEFRVDANDVVMVGDNKTDLEAAKNAGMRSLLVLTGHGKSFQTDAESNQIVESVTEAVTYLGVKI